MKKAPISTEDPLRTQVGGSHYKNAAIQPIEFAQANRLPPCEYSVLKYVSRWRDKNGVQDLEKAKHFIQILAALDYGRRETPPTDLHPMKFEIDLADYVAANKIPAEETEVLSLVLFHQYDKGDWGLVKAVKILDALIKSA